MATALWGSLIKSGYRVVYALQIDGIPYVFGARYMEAAVIASPGCSPPTGYTLSNALVIRDGMRFGGECDREKGLAAGRAIDFTLGRQQIADEGLGPILFARPSLRATLTAAVTDPAATTFNVDTTSGWGSSGSFYIGREYCTYAGKTGTSFTTVARGKCGEPHYHTASSGGAYRQCTDTPVYWRGRLVTLWEHLVSPEGRFLGDTWCELGDYCRQAWRGFIRDTPRPSQDGMVISCLPLVRLGAMEFGAELQGTMARDDALGIPYVVVEPRDQIFVANPSLSERSHPVRGFGGEAAIMTMYNYAALVQTSINDDDSTWKAQVEVIASGLRVIIPESEHFPPSGLIGPVSTVRGQAWFLDDGPAITGRDGYEQTDPWRADIFYYHYLPFRWWSRPGAYNQGSWIVMRVDPQEQFEDATIDSAGLIALDVGGTSEIIRYTETLTSDDGTLIAFRVGSRHMFESWSLATDGGASTDPWRTDTTIRVIAGAVGDWNECLRTILTSSGTGDRGPYDTAGYGFGGGLPDDWIATDLPNVPHDQIIALTPGKTTVEKLLCGWLALDRKCLVQRRDDDGSVVLDVVSTDVVDDTEAVTLTSADVLLDGHDTPEIIEAPNHVKITASDIVTQRPAYIVRDAARAQAEGVRVLEVMAPGIGPDRAVQLGGEMLLLGDGQSLVRMRLPPWVELQLGDAVEVMTEHPAIWDWSAGEFAPTSVLGRIVAHERDMYTQAQEVEALLAGQAAERINLCPAALIVTVGGHSTATLLHVARGDSYGFRAGDQVYVYERSNEDVDIATVEVVEVVTDVTYDAGVTYYDTIEVDADPGVTGSELIITYAAYGDAVTRQRRHMFVRSDKDWR